MFKDKILFISGGTGSFGNAVLDRILNSEIKEIRIFSRDEKKQDDMRKKYSNSKIKFYIGDVRDKSSINAAMRGVDYVFHAAALKQVPSCEFYPLQAVKTNILGTENVLNSAIENSVKKIICLSTDKAVYPINAMGMSKALMEKTFTAKAREIDGTGIVIAGTRYGNVMASRGSVIPLFAEQIKNGQPITITNPEMTRFMMSLEEAVELVFYAFQHADNGDIFVQKSPAATIKTIAESIKQKLNKPDHEIKVIGTRHGEKLYETLLTKEEFSKAKELERFYKIPFDQRDLNYGVYFETGDEEISAADEYNSDNTERLDVDQMSKMLDDACPELFL